MRYRPYLTNQFEVLMRVSDVLAPDERADQLAADLGIGSDDIHVGLTSCIGVPIHNPETGLRNSSFALHDYPGWPTQWPDGRPVPRWPSARPGALWNPLAWLPDELAWPLDVVDPETNTTEQEPWDLWAMRVCASLHLAGLYSADDGWLDVLEQVGIDTETEEGIERVTRWLDGTPDLILDTFSLDSFFDKPGLSAQEIYDQNVDLAPTMTGYNLAAAATSVIDFIDDLSDESDSLLPLAGAMLSAGDIYLPGLDIAAIEQIPDAAEQVRLIREFADKQLEQNLPVYDAVIAADLASREQAAAVR